MYKRLPQAAICCLVQAIFITGWLSHLSFVVQAFFPGGQRLNGDIVVAAQQVARAVNDHGYRQIAFEDGIFPHAIGIIVEGQAVADTISFAMKPLVAFDMFLGECGAANQQAGQRYGA